MIIPDISGHAGVIDLNNGTQRLYDATYKDVRLTANYAIGHLPVGNSQPRVDVVLFKKMGAACVRIKLGPLQPLSPAERSKLHDKLHKDGFAVHIPKAICN